LPCLRQSEVSIADKFFLQGSDIGLSEGGRWGRREISRRISCAPSFGVKEMHSRNVVCRRGKGRTPLAVTFLNSASGAISVLGVNGIEKIFPRPTPARPYPRLRLGFQGELRREHVLKIPPVVSEVHCNELAD